MKKFLMFMAVVFLSVGITVVRAESAEEYINALEKGEKSLTIGAIEPDSKEEYAKEYAFDQYMSRVFAGRDDYLAIDCGEESDFNNCKITHAEYDPEKEDPVIIGEYPNIKVLFTAKDEEKAQIAEEALSKINTEEGYTLEDFESINFYANMKENQNEFETMMYYSKDLTDAFASKNYDLDFLPLFGGRDEVEAYNGGRLGIFLDDVLYKSVETSLSIKHIIL